MIYVKTSKQDGIIIYVEKSKLNLDLKEKGLSCMYMYIYMTLYIWYMIYYINKNGLFHDIYICKGINKKGEVG